MARVHCEKVRPQRELSAYGLEKPGRMLMGFTPARQMEDFFSLSSKQPVDAKIAEAHGMKWLGPPLDVSKL